MNFRVGARRGGGVCGMNPWIFPFIVTLALASLILVTAKEDEQSREARGEEEDFWFLVYLAQIS